MIRKIRNLVFDMGNVLMRFEPETFMKRENITDPEDYDLLMNNIYKSKNWAKLDSGEWNEEDLLKHVCTFLPEHLHETAKRLIFHWSEPILPMEGMHELLMKCKKEGYHLYLLSNASRRQHDYWPNVAGFDLFDGTVISADILSMKPDPAIFLHLLEKYDLKAEDSLFIDDMEKNIKGAESLGFLTYQFHEDPEGLVKFIFD